MPDKLDVEKALRAARAMHREGRLDQAAAAFEGILKVTPKHADALHYCGLLQHHMGRTREGIELIERGIAESPGNRVMYSNLGKVYRHIGDTQGALRAYSRALDAAPDDVDIQCALGAVYRQRKQFDEARVLLEKVIAAEPENAEAFNQLGLLASDQRDVEASIGFLEKAVALSDSDEKTSDAALNLASVLIQSSKPPEAAQVLQELLARQPGNPTARHLLAAVTGTDVPQKADENYVGELFDGFAASFDKKLIDALHYRGPRLIEDKLRTVLVAPQANLNVLDAGCGTGLAGSVVKPYAERLTGVDLSARMLAKARARGIYDELLEQELEAFLQTAGERFDLIVCADVLVYFGDLSPIVAGAARCLNSGGYFCFTLEKVDAMPSGTGYELMPHGRYSHHRSYVRRSLQQVFESIQVDDVIIRLEGGQPVTGMVVIARARV